MYSLKKKKIRGARRKYNKLLERLVSTTNDFPDLENQLYWHLHMPCSDLLLNSPKTPSYIRSGCIKTIIERTKYLINIKPHSMRNSKVVAAISIPYLWDSQIIVFNDNEYFNSFFDRNDKHHKWLPISNEDTSRFLNKWSISTTGDLEIKGYKEIICDDDYNYQGEIWFIGELSMQI